MNIKEALPSAAEQEAARRLMDAWRETGYLERVPWTVIEEQMLSDYGEACSRPSLTVRVLTTLVYLVVLDWGMAMRLWNPPNTIMHDYATWYEIISAFGVLNSNRWIVQHVENVGRDRYLRPTKELALLFGASEEEVTGLVGRQQAFAMAEFSMTGLQAALADPAYWDRVRIEGDAAHLGGPLLAQFMNGLLEAPAPTAAEIAEWCDPDALH